jgi:hypothetical protein
MSYKYKVSGDIDSIEQLVSYSGSSAVCLYCHITTAAVTQARLLITVT